ARRRDFLPNDPAERAARLEGRVRTLQRNGLRLRDEATRYRAALLRIRTEAKDAHIARIADLALTEEDGALMVTDAEAEALEAETGFLSGVARETPERPLGMP
ncbi:MAG: hypothetical protein ACRDI2_07375, partial [Chloroflexota bacterium]